MARHPSHAPLPPAQVAAQKLFGALERYLRIEAGSGIALIAATVAALLWVNSPLAGSYHQFWDSPVALHLGSLSVSQSLHFVVNDGLMTVFFLVVGLEIRREMHEGVLADWRVAALPLAAALGGVVVPAGIYLALVDDPALRAGWAIPTATDIAFAVGVLALLGKSIPIGVRMFLLTFAIVDDVAAILIIALFYSGGIDYAALWFIAAGMLLVVGLQGIGVGSSFAYVAPGGLIWFGLLKAGLHPALAGVILGMMTPVRALGAREGPLDVATRALGELTERVRAQRGHSDQVVDSVRTLKAAQRELLPPVIRVQAALHPWVAYGIMPLFALANAGVSLQGIDLQGTNTRVISAIAIALVVGKPVGILLGSWLAVRTGACHLAPGLTWPGVLLAACLGGIGFTMSIFIATLAFPDAQLLAAAKLGVLVASLTAGAIGWMVVHRCARRARGDAEPEHRSTHATGPKLERGQTMHTSRILGALAGMLLPFVTPALELPSSAELAEQCRSYLDEPDGHDGRFCAAYIQGFIDGSPLVAILHNARSTETFSERAARTRLGRPVSARPQYCIDSATTMAKLISQLLAQANTGAQRDDTDASVLLYATLASYHRCPSR